MPRHTVYVVARGEDAVAAPFDIVTRILAREPAVVVAGEPRWKGRALTMEVVADARDRGSARGIVEGAVARHGADVYRRFAFSIVPLDSTPSLR